MRPAVPPEVYVAAQICPQCRGSYIEAPALSNVAKCKSCDWVGTQEQLLTLASSVMPEDRHDQLVRMMAESWGSTVAAGLSLPLGRFLLQWGFLEVADRDRPEFVEDLATYTKAVAEAGWKAIVETRVHLAAKKKGGASGPT